MIALFGAQVMNAPLEPAHSQIRRLAAWRGYLLPRRPLITCSVPSKRGARIVCPGSTREMRKLPVRRAGMTAIGPNPNGCHDRDRSSHRERMHSPAKFAWHDDRLPHDHADDDCETAMPARVTNTQSALLDTPGAEYFLEQRVSTFRPSAALSGRQTNPRIGDTIYIIDFKFGPVRVRVLYPDDDGDIPQPQLLFYAAAARHSLPNFFRRRRAHHLRDRSAAGD